MIPARHLLLVLVVTVLCGVAASCGQRDTSDSSSASSPESPNEEPTAQRKDGDSEQHAALSLNELLPTRDVNVEVMGFGMSERTEQLTTRWQQAIREHAEWFGEYMKNRSPGKPLPYHPNFGLTEDEYADMTQGMTDVKAQIVGNARLTIVDKGNGVVGFDGVGAVAALNSVEINTKTGTIQTQFGKLEEHDRISRGEDSPLGPFDGFFWNLSEGSVESGTFLSVRIGVAELVDVDRTFIDYRVKRIQPEGPPERVDVLIQFELTP